MSTEHPPPRQPGSVGSPPATDGAPGAPGNGSPRPPATGPRGAPAGAFGGEPARPGAPDGGGHTTGAPGDGGRDDGGQNGEGRGGRGGAGHDPVRDPWRAAMRHALEEARHAPDGGDVPVGAVVLAGDGTVLAAAHNEREATGDPTAHAEVLALRRAAALRGGWRLTDCTLVVTLEPCTMCAGAAVLARVDRIVHGARDDKAGAVGSLWDVVRDRRLNHRPEVIGDVLAADCAALLTAFFRTR